MILKSGVNPHGLRPELLLALVVADGVWRELGQELVVTSLNDGEHSRASLHYDGAAADLRIHYFDQSQRLQALALLKSKLGGNPDYDIVLEDTHIHIEYQPKFRGVA